VRDRNRRDNGPSDLRKRPRQRRAETTFDAILESAARILAREGPERLTTNRIARDAGVSVGSLYQYFPNKRAIVRALLERRIARAESARPAAIDDASLSPEERMRAVVDWHFDVHGADPRLDRALRRLAPDVLPASALRRVADLRADRTRRTVSALLARAGDPAQAAFVVSVCLDALAGAAAGRRTAWLASAAFREEVALLLSRYLAR
jgi:AcrR family transcriptional regulator